MKLRQPGHPHSPRTRGRGESQHNTDTGGYLTICGPGQKQNDALFGYVQTCTGIIVRCVTRARREPEGGAMRVVYVRGRLRRVFGRIPRRLSEPSAQRPTRRLS